MADDDILRLTVFTDSHLGFQERDPTRCDDSFAAYEEALKYASDNKSDAVVHAGDMFHENRPSRRALHSCMKVLRKYCMGDAAVRFEILNEQEHIFAMNGGMVNFENPHQSISLPIFAIHGNHDDPTREGTGSDAKSLAALDLLAVSNFINYYGKQDQTDDITITPVLIHKRKTYVALYGLGAMRDERLHRMWHTNKVKFCRPPNPTDTPDNPYFNILVLHQNRDYGRGKKNCIHESMIPEWMDLVIWGNEHECIPTLQESLVGTYRILQPGSSVATSLSEGESQAHPKTIACVHIKERKFRLLTEPFSQVRPFVYGELKLSDVPTLRVTDPKIEDAIKAVVKRKVDEMVADARTSSDKVLASAEAKELLFYVKEPRKVLIRLRIDHAGFQTINPTRFGQSYVSEVANPGDMLAFSKKQKFAHRVVEGKQKYDKDARTAGEKMKQALADGEEDAVQMIKIEDLVSETLTGKQSLQIISEDIIGKALEDFVNKKNGTAIIDAMTEVLEHCQEGLWTDESVGPDKDAISEAICKVRPKSSDKKFQDKRAQAAKARPKVDDDDDDESMDLGGDDDEDEDEDDGGKKKKKPAAKKAAPSKKPPAKKAPAKPTPKPHQNPAKPKAAASRGHGKKAAADSDEDERLDSRDQSRDDEDETSPQGKKGAGRGAGAGAAGGGRKSTRAVPKKSYAADDDEDVEDIDDDDDYDDRPRGPGWSNSSRSAAPSSSRGAAKQASVVVDLVDDVEEEEEGSHRGGYGSNASSFVPTAYSATSAVADSQALGKKRALPGSMAAGSASSAPANKKKTANLNWED